MKKFSVILMMFALSLTCACNGQKKANLSPDTSTSGTSSAIASPDVSADQFHDASDTTSASDPASNQQAPADALSKTTIQFLKKSKAPTTPLEERLTRKPAREELPEAIAAVFYDDAPFSVVVDLAADAAEGKNRLEVQHEFKLSDYNYLPTGDSDLYWRKYLIGDFDGDGTDELFFEVSAKPDMADNWNNYPSYFLFFEESDSAVTLHVLRDDAYYNKYFDYLWSNPDWVLAGRPLEERLLVAPAKEEVRPEIAAVLYDNAPFTVLQDDYLTDDARVFYSNQYTMSEYDWCSSYAHKDSDISTGVYMPTEIFWRAYTTADLDGNGTEELIYYISTDDAASGHYLMFAVVDGEVYAYTVGYRAMEQITPDGTIMGSSAADRADIWMVGRFRKGGYDEKILASMNGEEYTVRGKKATSEEFFKYMNEDRSTESVHWTAIETDDSWLNYYSRGEH
ncbi:MAG: hypothetical protein IKR39_04485 [Lachnospiraceae bacterium]|nr:hypothetical protein [Lachnospiraceae bacterium]